MLRIARTRRALAGLAVATLLAVSIATPAVAGDEVVVRSGDTLWDIAAANGTTVAALVALNQIANPSLIRIGQRIVLRAPATTIAPPQPAPPAPVAPIIYVVRPADTLWGIALHHGTTVAALAEANSLADPSFIRIGQALAIPQAATASPGVPVAAAPTPAPTPRTVHVVQAGETLWVISAQYGVSISAIVVANALADPSFIRTGQQLVIPGATPAPAPAAPQSVTNASMPPEMASQVAARTSSRDLLLAAAAEFAVPGPFVLAVAWQESGWQPAAVSFAGAVGLMQLMPDTADWVASAMLGEAPVISDARWNARAGTRLLAFYLARYGGDRARTLAAYFQGMGSLEQEGIKPSSQAYIASILSLETIFGR